jgi:hypothetical protein
MKQQDRIGGQDVIWSVWKVKGEKREVMCAEVFLVSAVWRIPNTDVTHEEKFHIFLSSGDQTELSSLQDIVRTLKKKSEELSTSQRSK